MIRNIINSLTSRKTLVENVFFLFIFQGANYVLPLITLPYLLRVFGPNKFGLMVFAQAFVQYFNLVTDYGFNLSATRQVAIFRNDKEKVGEIFSAVMFIKASFMFLCFFLLLLIVGSFTKFSSDRQVYLGSFTLVIGNVLFPIWFFQGIEKMKHITLGTIVLKTLTTASIFIFVHSESDILLAILLQNLGNILSGLLATLIIVVKYSLKIRFPSLLLTKSTLASGWDVFISTAAINFYTTTNIFVLGLISNNTAVGNYGAAEKLIRSIMGAFSPFSQGLYPHITAIVARSKIEAVRFIRKVLRLLGTASFLVSSFLMVFARQIVMVVFGHNYTDSVIILRLLSLIPFVVTLSSIFGMQTLLPFDLSRYFRKAIVVGGIVNLAAVVPLTLLFGEQGTAMSYLLTETVVAICMFIFLERNDIRLLSFEISERRFHIN